MRVHVRKWLVRRKGSERRSNARQQLPDRKRLYDVIVRPRIESNNLIVWTRVRRYTWIALREQCFTPTVNDLIRDAKFS